MKKVASRNGRLGLGWMPDLPDNRDHLYSAPLAKLRVLPTKADLRRRCPRVYNQGQIGPCTANAIAAAIEFDRKKQKLRDFIPSRLFIYYNERSIEHSIPLDNGAQIRDGIKSVAKQGACPETEWPYDDTPADSITNLWPPGAKPRQKPSRSCYTHAKKFRAVNYQRVDRMLSQMKGCLAASRARKRPGRACCKCPSREKELSAVTLSLQLATMTRPSVSWCAIRGARAGAKEVTSRCLTLICSPTIFQTTSGPFAWCINLTPY
jgi:hypothetical protein